MKNITGENINMLPNYHSVSLGFIKLSGYWRNWVGPIKRLRMEPLPFQLVSNARCIFLCVVLDLVRASFTLSRYCAIVHVHLLPPWANLSLLCPTLELPLLLPIWPLCVILRPRNYCHPRLERSCCGREHFLCWGQVGAQQPTSTTQAQPIFLCIVSDLVSVYGQCSLSLVLEPSWGPTTNLSHPDTTSHCSGAQQPPAPIWNPPNCSSPNAMDVLQCTLGIFSSKTSTSGEFWPTSINVNLLSEYLVFSLLSK